MAISLLSDPNRPLTGQLRRHEDAVREMDDVDLEIECDQYFYLWSELEQAGDTYSAGYCEFWLDVLATERARHSAARERHPNHPLVPTRREAKQHRLNKHNTLVAYLKQRWPIDRFLTELMLIELTPTGTNRRKGLCPFHDDHNPSMDVDLDMGTFHCWTCGARGDVFDFIGRRYWINFPEQVEMLADATLDLPEDYSSHSDSPSGRSRRNSRKRVSSVRLVAGKVVAQ